MSCGYWIYPGERRPVVVKASTCEEAIKKIVQSHDYDGFPIERGVYTVEQFALYCESQEHVSHPSQIVGDKDITHNF